MFISCFPQNDSPGPTGPKGAKGHRGPEGKSVSVNAPCFQHVFTVFFHTDVYYGFNDKNGHICSYFDSSSPMKVHMSMIFCTVCLCQHPGTL